MTTPLSGLSSCPPSASAHPVPAGTFRYRGQPLLLLGSLFNPRHSRSLGRLLATYLLTYRAPGRREKATYLLFGTTGTELRSSSINQTLRVYEQLFEHGGFV